MTETKTYNARLATRLTSSVDSRLRQFALLRRRRISHLLDEVLDQALPTTQDLAGQFARLADTTPEPSPATAPPVGRHRQRRNDHRDVGAPAPGRMNAAQPADLAGPASDSTRDRAQAWLRTATTALAPLPQQPPR